MNFNFEKQKSDKLQEIESIITSFLPKEMGYQKTIADAMEYSLLAGGKRLRPMLMLETYHLFGGTGNLIKPFMAAIEMIHTYSLVHDDLPAMDNDDYRRGQKTTHIVYGEDMGILAGDALLNYAFETVATAFDQYPSQALLIGKAIQVLSGKAGIYGMIGGQVIDVQASGDSISKDKLDVIFELKTSALIESAMMIGAILAGAEEGNIRKIEKLAKNVGISFQIQDDILDVSSVPEILGKPTHSDEKNEKTTYVTLIGLENAKKEATRISKEAIELLHQIMDDLKESGINSEGSYLTDLLEALIDREK